MQPVALRVWANLSAATSESLWLHFIDLFGLLFAARRWRKLPSRNRNQRVWHRRGHLHHVPGELPDVPPHHPALGNRLLLLHDTQHQAFSVCCRGVLLRQRLLIRPQLGHRNSGQNETAPRLRERS